MFNELGVSKSKLTQTVRGLIVYSLGVLAGCYPQYMKGHAESYASTCMKSLQSVSY